MKSLEMLRIKSFVIFAAFVTTTSVFASKGGHGAGNGGTALVCNQKVSVPEFVGKTMLADFAETSILKGLKGKLTISESDDEIDTQIENALKKIKEIDESVYQTVQTELWRIKTSAEPVGNYYWPVTSDVGSFPMPLPEGSCELKNSVNYLEDDDIQRNETLIGSMPKTHQAGLWVHEAVYSVMRSKETVTNAVPARRMTALLFADEKFPELLTGFVKAFLMKDQNSDIVPQVIPRTAKESEIAKIKIPSQLLRYIQVTNCDGEITLFDRAIWRDDGTSAVAEIPFRHALVIFFEPPYSKTEEWKQLVRQSTLSVAGRPLRFEVESHGNLLIHGGFAISRDVPEVQKPTVERYLKGWLDL